LGEVLHFFLPLPIPASIYGLLLMLAGLCSGVIKLSSVKETGKFLVEIMPVMFIPAGVGLLDTWGILKPVWLPVVFITLSTTVLVMAVSGLVSQWVVRRKEGGEAK
jgi:holin-like protein